MQLDCEYNEELLQVLVDAITKTKIKDYCITIKVDSVIKGRGE